MLFTGNYITRASGSLGGVTASHNRGGQYLRARVVPTDPNTTRQQTMRTHFAAASSDWNSTLTNFERTTWIEAASRLSRRNRLGEPIVLTGQQFFMFVNMARLAAQLLIVKVPPAQVQYAVPAQNVFVTYVIPTTINVNMSNPAGTTVALYAGQGVNSEAAGYHGPWRQVTSSGTWPQAALPNPWPVGLGQWQWFETVLHNDDGQRSDRTRHGPFLRIL